MDPAPTPRRPDPPKATSLQPAFEPSLIESAEGGPGGAVPAATPPGEPSPRDTLPVNTAAVSAGSFDSAAFTPTLLQTNALGATPSARVRTPELPPDVRAAFDDPARRIGQYAILGELGRGGMGIVHRAYDTALRRPVAIKMIRDVLNVDPVQLERFEREGSAVGRLRHPGIVSVFEVGVHEGKPFMVMELVSGSSLESILRKEPLPHRRAAEIARDLARALDHAHQNGVVHRDVKPENVYVDDTGATKLMDFGLAHDVTLGGERMTVTGTVLGTPSYMSPEQADGDSASHGPLSDVYSLGAVLYRALTGAPPFEAATLQVLIRKVTTEEPVPLRAKDPTIAADLETITLRCLAKEPGARYSTAHEVADELQRYLDGHTILARRVGPGERALRWIVRNRVVAALGASLAAVLVVAVLLTVAFVKAERETADERARDEARRKGDEEKRAAEEARRKDDEARRAADEARRARIQERLRAGDAAYAAADYDGAIAAFTSAIALDPSLMAAYMKRGDARTLRHPIPAAKSPEEAALNAACVDDFTMAHELEPTNPGPLYRRGARRLAMNELDAASADLTEALTLDPRLAVAYTFRARVRVKQKDPDGAIADALMRIELNTDKAGHTAQPAWDALATDVLAALQPGRAVAVITSLVQTHPEETAPLRIRGEQERRWADVDKRRHVQHCLTAITDFSRAFALDPKDALLLIRRADAKGAIDDWNGALADYTAALALEPKNAAAWRGRGFVRQRLGDKDGAASDLEKSLELPPRPAPGELNRVRAALKDLRAGR